MRKGIITVVVNRWLLAILFLCAACGKKENKAETLPDMAFDKSKWSIRTSDGKNYMYRRQMVNDLVKHYHWEGVSKDSVTQLLGPPDDIEAEVVMQYYYEEKGVLGGIMENHQALSFELTGDRSKVKTAKLSKGLDWNFQ